MVLMEQTQWMDAKQAIKIGLVDRIWTGKMDRKITGALLNANSKT
jgi:ATP-dependent protease ClpP protease subunit